jgi:hypothetical protein
MKLIVVPDDGTVIGLTRSEMDASLSTLEQMASEVGATVLILKEIVITGVKRPDRFAKCWFQDQVVIKAGSRRDREVDKWGNGSSGQNGRARQLIFEEDDLAEESGTVPVEKGDEDIHPFHLDLDMDGLTEEAIVPVNVTKKWRKIRKKAVVDTEKKREQDAEKRRKGDIKRAKAAEKREARRLDLLRGDGMSPPLFDDPLLGSSVDNVVNTIPEVPAPRTSSLRLAVPVSTPTPNLDDEETQLLNDLISLPLDSLSLSFADVQTVRARSPSISSSSSSTEYAPDQEDVEEDEDIEELLCVEALVVRKVNHDEEQEVVDGAEDAWGFGFDDDEVAVEESMDFIDGDYE